MCIEPLGQDLITMSADLLPECLCRCSSNSRPNSRKSITTCSHTKSKTSKGAPEEELKTGSEDPGEKEEEEKRVPM